MNVFVLGSGAWGTALALLLLDNGHMVTLWSHNADKAAAMRRTHKNPALPGVVLPKNLGLTGNIEEVSDCDMALFVTPSYAFRQTAERAAPFIRPGTVLVSATKGIERDTDLRMSQILREVIGPEFPVAALSGPTHAEEVSRRMAAGCVAACANQAVAELVQRTFMNKRFRVYINQDVVGVELCGAVKNVVALGCGIVDGLALGDNAEALFMTRAMAEIAVLCQKAGGRRTTCSGLAGMGDLIVTCGSGHSRNRRAGLLIGRGTPVEQALREIGAVVEGYYAAASVMDLARELDTELPICRCIYGILYMGKEPSAELERLMERGGKSEFDTVWE